jgi:hypothetical protein
MSCQLRTLCHFSPLKTAPRYPLYKMLDGPQSRTGRYGEEKNLLPLLRIEPRLRVTRLVLIYPGFQVTFGIHGSAYFISFASECFCSLFHAMFFPLWRISLLFICLKDGNTRWNSNCTGSLFLYGSFCKTEYEFGFCYYQSTSPGPSGG